jgi:hypothetical protein
MVSIMRYVSVSDVVSFYRCRACFLERLRGGGRERQTVKSLLGEMLHELAGGCLRGEAEMMERLHADGCLDPKSLQKCYREAAKGILRSVIWKYGGRLVELGGSLEDAETLLLRALESIVKQGTLELFKSLRSMGLRQLLLQLHERSFGRRLYSNVLRICGSPDMLEADRVVEFKYFRPGHREMVREDIVLQLSLYSMLSGRRSLRVIYLPSFIHQNFWADDGMTEWALGILDELFSFLSHVPGEAEHTCAHQIKYVSVGGELLWAGYTSSPR